MNATQTIFLKNDKRYLNSRMHFDACQLSKMTVDKKEKYLYSITAKQRKNNTHLFELFLFLETYLPEVYFFYYNRIVSFRDFDKSK